MGLVVLSGPSGSGKSRLAARLGWPVLRLDDFYREHSDPGMPQSSLGIIDWDHPESWDHEAAMEAITSLCHNGVAEVPVYDIGLSERVGAARLSAPDGRFVAEGLFATRIIDECRKACILDAAICVRHHRLVTFALRLSRDLREGRKAPRPGAPRLAAHARRAGHRRRRGRPRLHADDAAPGREVPDRRLSQKS